MRFEELVDAAPSVAKDMLAAEIMKFARVDHEGLLFLGVALLDQNRLDESEKSLREALLRKPQYADVYLVLADVHTKRKDYQCQIQDLDTYMKLVPTAPGIAYVRKVREAAQRLAASSPHN